MMGEGATRFMNLSPIVPLDNARDGVVLDMSGMCAGVEVRG